MTADAEQPKTDVRIRDYVSANRGGGEEWRALKAAQFVCAERERELLELKGPCSNQSCPLHHAHSGPCNERPKRERRDPSRLP